LPPKTATSAAKEQRADPAREDGGAAPAAPPRRARAWIVALTGAVLGLAFGVGVERMFLGPPLIMVGLGGMTLALSGLALWRMIDPLTRPEATLAREAQGRGRARELEREKQLVLKAIKEIELDYQMRKIAERDYREMIERYRARAIRLIGDIEAGDDFTALIERELQIRLSAAPATASPAAPAAHDARRTCAGCTTVNDQDAEFCKKCGEKLKASA
jgi:rRNA maturation endonuclease Nob1